MRDSWEETLASLREDVCQGHEVQRQTLTGLEAAMRDGDEAGARRLALRLLASRTLEITLLNDVLGPILRHIDAWGTERERALYDAHAREEEELRRIGSLLRDRRRSIAGPLIAFATRLRRELEREERDFLSDDLLRDDPISVDEFGG